MVGSRLAMRGRKRGSYAYIEATVWRENEVHGGKRGRWFAAWNREREKRTEERTRRERTRRVRGVEHTLH